MEESLRNSLDEFIEEIQKLDNVDRLNKLSKRLKEKYPTIKDIKDHKDDYLVSEFFNELAEVENLSILITDVFKKELEL